VWVEGGSGAVIATHYYDPFGRRLWKEVDDIRTYFVYSDEGLVGEYDSSGSQFRSYGYKPGSNWTNDPLFLKVGSEYYFYQNDHLGTPQKLTAVNGAVVWLAKYSAFGEAIIDPASTATNNLRFAGQFFDAETKLHYNWFRYYDPNIGKYYQTDPLNILGQKNRYLYVANQPLKLIDPYGLFEVNLKRLPEFHHYGRWGGPGYTAGMWTTWDGIPQEYRNRILADIDSNPASIYAPVDKQDECYMGHDICCGNSRMKCHKKNDDCYDNCVRNKISVCDKELSKCLLKIGFSSDVIAEAHRLVAIPAFILRPPFRNAVHNNKKNRTNFLLSFEF
jgi:RHS repeat-associated protein